MRCAECETPSIESRFCECCGRPLTEVEATDAVVAETVGAEADHGWAPVEMPHEPSLDVTRSAPTDEAPGQEVCPSPGMLDISPASAAPSPEEVPPPAPGSREYLQTHEAFTAHDSGHVRDTMTLHGVVDTDRATTPDAAASRADEMTSSLVADHAVRDLSEDDGLPAPPPWWAARVAPAVPKAPDHIATRSASADGPPPAAEAPRATTPPAAAAPVAAPAPARNPGPVRARSAAPRVAARQKPLAGPPRQRALSRHPVRFAAHAAVAMIAVTIAALLGAPTLKQWSQAPDRQPDTTAYAARSAGPTHDVASAPATVAATAPADTVRQAPWRESSPPRASEPVASARAANATSAPARAPRKDRRTPLPTPARVTELPAPQETMEPLAAAPLAAAASDAMVMPPSVAPPPPVAASPTTALEVTKVDVRPEIVRRVNARTSKAAAGTPEMVVLRVLVSAAGSPATVQVLRGSKVDPDSDGAAVAAVKQWAFSPALKRGRPVDCWFNVAVPVEGTVQ